MVVPFVQARKTPPENPGARKDDQLISIDQNENVFLIDQVSDGAIR